MARLSQDSSSGAEAETSHDPALLNISQLLHRLQQSVLHPTPERELKLRRSELERARVEANIQVARSLLDKVEQDEKIAVSSQAVLKAHRETLEMLMERMDDLNKIAVDEEDEGSDEEDLLGNVVATPSESIESAPASAHQQEAQAASPSQEALRAADSSSSRYLADNISTEPEASSQASATQTEQSLRSRHTTNTAPATDAADAASVSTSVSSHAKARAALFASRRLDSSSLSSPAPPQTSTATAEALLDQQRAEHDALSESILRMASALKANSQRFSTTLEADRDVLGRAGEGIERTERGMEAARGRMGMLRRMTEGKGWWGRMVLYAWVYGLIVGLVLLVFVMPKLRF
ncbi:hypothetical protein CDD81_6761 [Ophiocordyceps australis]|uniref:Synaptobrevin n=1 Tax=Ophiocordyceps australis TaxID=1399860 RepID=A0A2C5Y629_9HYPO|nr:hypothetical protein CDD81_6761 [Ophiocordyceps australis]